MSKLKNIKQDNNSKKTFTNPMLELLHEKQTKAQLMEKLGLSERRVRENISMCAMYYPVLATSDKKGYRLAKNINNLEDENLIMELEEINHAINEINSRIKCLKKRLKPLIAYKKVAEAKLGGEKK